MLDIFAREPGILVAVVAIVAGTLIAVTAVLAYHWLAARRTEAESALKRDMLERGMSAEEIERVIRATSASPAPSAAGEKSEALSETEMEYVERWAKAGMSGEQIERLLRAGRTPAPPTPARADQADRNPN
jgi:hypothetical protein